MEKALPSNYSKLKSKANMYAKLLTELLMIIRIPKDNKHNKHYRKRYSPKMVKLTCNFMKEL